MSAHTSVPHMMYRLQKTGQYSFRKLPMLARSLCLKAAWRVLDKAASGGTGHQLDRGPASA